MKTLTLTEAVLVELMARGGVDDTNVITLLRGAQDIVRPYARERGYGMNDLMDIDLVDDIMIGVSQNGRKDIFA